MEKFKNSINGITLVALVITIIILLILAGITISSLTNTGIFGKAKEAKNLTQEKTAEENEILTNYLEQINTIIGRQKQETVPDGAMVTPITDVTIWLKTGGLSKQYSYTTIEEVIANNTCIESLMNNENAMKYLARSTGFADAICSSETAMTYLGNSSYLDNTVLNNDLWLSKIRESEHWQKLAKIPVTIYGGASEKITISGLNGSPSITTNSNGSITYNLIKGSYTFTGAVSGQSFTRTITNSSTKVYAMPECALYWYGNNNNFTSTLDNNLNYYGGSISFNANNIKIVCGNDGNGILIQLNSNINASKYSKIKIITNYSNRGKYENSFALSKSKIIEWTTKGFNDLTISSTETMTGLRTTELDISSFDKDSVNCLVQYNSKGNGYIYAVWLE